MTPVFLIFSFRSILEIGGADEMQCREKIPFRLPGAARKGIVHRVRTSLAGAERRPDSALSRQTGRRLRVMQRGVVVL